MKMLHRKHHLLALLLLTTFTFQPVTVHSMSLVNQQDFDTTRTNYNYLTMDRNKTYGIITNEFASMHDSHSFLSPLKIQLSYGNFVEILEVDGIWSKVKFFGQVGYITSATLETLADSETYSTDEQVIGSVDAKSLNVRDFPTVSESTVIGSLKQHTYVDILAKVGDWYQIKFENLLAFVSADYIDIIHVGRITDTDYASTFTELVQTYTITHSSSSNRNHNLATAASIINGDTSGYILRPNDKFDWFYIIGDTTPEKGYLKAGIIENRVSSVGYGGGCCEVASTINSAIVELGIPTNAHSHSVQPRYLVGHHEATVSYDSGINFTFVNTLDYAIKIEVTTNKGNVTVNVYKVPEK